MIKNKQSGIICLLFCLFSSCGSDFSDPKPLSFYAPENVLIDEAGLQAVLDKALTSLREEFCTDQAPLLTNMKYSDIAVDGSTDKATPWQDLNNQMLPDATNNTLANTKIGWYWDNTYINIKDCNTVINRIDEAAFTSEESKWTKMVKDLEFAIKHVPEANQTNNGQITKAACKHLLAKYYLLEGRFDDAIRITTEVIDGGVHQLCTERFGSDKNVAEKDVVWDMFRIENKSLSENTEGLLISIIKVFRLLTATISPVLLSISSGRSLLMR